ncbi:MAG: hypothetical protein IJ264_06020 [Clostridia bacterium]|nr:hypothetical protein [Clostridia bacterium]
MKKIFILLIVLLFVFLVSCNKENTFSPVNRVAEDYHSTPPTIITSFNDLKEIKSALNTKDSASFISYMQENYSNLVLNGMRDFESARELLDELEETTVLLLGNASTFNDNFSFYYERNEVHVFSTFSDGKRAACYSFTPENQLNETRDLSLNENLIFVKEVLKDGVAVKIYDSMYDDRGFHAEIRIDGTYITFWLNQKQTIEAFEADIEKCQLIKIGELLNESYAQLTQSETEYISQITDETTNQEVTMLTEETVVTEQTDEVTSE